MHSQYFKIVIRNLKSEVDQFICCTDISYAILSEIGG